MSAADSSGPVAPEDAPSRPDRLVGLVLARGAATASILAMPAAFANVVLADQTPPAQAGINISFAVVFIGLFLGGWLAGREAPSQKAKHGAIAALIAFIPVEVIAILGRLDRGDPVRIGGIIIFGLLAACAGTAGAQLSSRRHRRERP